MKRKYTNKKGEEGLRKEKRRKRLCLEEAEKNKQDVRWSLSLCCQEEKRSTKMNKGVQMREGDAEKS